MSAESDTELAARVGEAMAGAAGVLDELVAEFYPQILSFLKRLLRNTADAEDAAQQDL